ncbi:MAG TPA: alanine racemase [Gemmatimonadales bacterium]|nr:alanine racemase [Gemmatimonadales bacterium]
MPSIPPQPSRAWVEVNLAALVQNARTVGRISGVRLLPMVKAGAYGLGAIPCAHALDAVDPWGFGVVTLQEGIDLRAAQFTRPIVVFTPLTAAQLEECRAHQLRPVLGDRTALEAWLALGDAPFHLEVDTGMSRCGFRWDADRSWIDALKGASGFEGILTHFHSSDTDPASIPVQWSRFQSLIGQLPARPPLVHAANSAAALRGTAWAGDLVRPGIFLYGGAAAGITPEPVVQLKAPVVALRSVRSGESVSYGATWSASCDTILATIAAGYADGVPRALGNQGLVEIGERTFPIVGRVTMDFLMVAVDDGVQPGDIATIYGGRISLDEQATRAGTISYELLTSLGTRVPRQYASHGGKA